MTINFGSDSPLNIDNLGTSYVVSGSPIGWYNSKRINLRRLAQQYLNTPPLAVQVLRSQGEADATIPPVVATRRGYNQLRVQLPVMNQFYNYTSSHGGTPDADYLAKIKEVVLAWVRLNEPDGKPINETNLEGLLRVIDDRYNNFSSGEQNDINDWLQALRIARENWDFAQAPGEGTIQFGNHYAHHYKILLKIYEIQGATTQYNNLITEIQAFALENFPFGNEINVVPPQKFTLTGVNQGTKTFTIAGNHADKFFTTQLDKVFILSANANRGWYTLVSAANNGANTDIVVLESITLGAVSGSIFGSYNSSIHNMSREAIAAGESIDNIRRDAFHYHQYDLEPWLEIAITAGGTTFETLMDNGMSFFSDEIFSPPRKRYEFFATTDTFDALRWEASRSEYLQPNMMYKPSDAARVVFAYQYYKQQINPSYQIDTRWLSTAFNSDVLPSHWFYFFRWVFNGIYT